MKRVVVFTTIALLFITSCQSEKFKVSEKKDSNGLSYITVTNDPFNARIYSLENGLTVYLSRSADQPRISALIGVKAGSAYEDPNATGLAHYLEHMMFKGTSKIGSMNWEKEKVLLDMISDLFEEHRSATDTDTKRSIYRQIDSLSYIAAGYVATNELDKIYSAIGDNMLNAGTSYESTVYMCEIPNNEIEKWAEIESERFSDVVLRLFHTELETVYEEFNMYQDMDDTRAFNLMMSKLFPSHPYGRDVIGLPEHLKNPSMEEIRKFIDNYYVPNNIAISLSGDFEFEATIKLINEYFGGWSEGEVRKPQRPVEQLLEQVQKGEVTGPEEEYVTIAWRTAGTGTQDEIMTTIISSLLYNGQAGLFDINLNQSQKVKSSSASAYVLKDYGLFYMDGYPRQGQTLESVEELLLNQTNLIKKGEFEEWMLEAIINNAKLDYMRSLERTSSRANMMMNSFINETPFNEFVSFIDNLSKITKDQVIAYANEKLADNYVVIYKRIGDNAGLVKVDKPEITPVDINRDQESDFAINLLAQKSPPIEPVFVDFNKALIRKSISEGVDFFYSPNDVNGLFSLTYVIDVGKDHNINLPTAFGYGSLLGTSTMSPEELQKELYRYGLSLSMSSSSRQSTLSISGLNENIGKGVELLELIMSDIKADQEVLNSYIDKILKERDDNKMNIRSIRSALENYSLYGNDSPDLYLISEADLKNLKAEELTGLIKGITDYPFMISYFGPSTTEEVISLIPARLKSGEIRSVRPTLVTRKPVINSKPVVYVVDYEISQAHISIAANCELFNSSMVPEVQIFNNFFGQIVFQEIREAKGLAYTATASIRIPAFSDQMIRFSAFMSTQADKLGSAIDGMSELMNEMPGDEKSFRLSCEGLMNNISTQRFTNRALFNTWNSYKLQGINTDIREQVYQKASTISLAEMKSFFDNYISNKNYSFLIVGNKNLLDFKVLNKIGEVKVVTLEEIFGY